MSLLCGVLKNIENVITKAGEIRLDESLATLQLVEGATFYSYLLEADNQEFFPFLDNIIKI